MKVFITGSTGFLGKSLLLYLRDKMQMNCFEYKRGTNVADHLQYFKPDVIIHSAGEIYNRDQMFSSNIELTYKILEYVRQTDIKMIYFGSSSEYGKVEYPMSETNVCNPQTVYAATKTAGTVLCQAYAREYNRDICTIRPFSVYGDHEPSHRLIPTLFRNISNNIEVNLIDGEHDFIYIDDFINIVLRVMNSKREITQADIINAGTGIAYSNKAVAKIVMDILNVDADIKYIDFRKVQDSEHWSCDTYKLLAKYNFTPAYTLKEGLKSYYNFLLKNPV